MARMAVNNPIARLFAGLAVDARLAILDAITKGAEDQRAIVAATGLGDSTVAHHLVLMVRLGLVKRVHRSNHTSGDVDRYRITPLTYDLIQRVLRELSPVGRNGLKYERDDPVTGDPLPAGVQGFPINGRRDRALTSAVRGR